MGQGFALLIMFKVFLISIEFNRDELRDIDSNESSGSKDYYSLFIILSQSYY